MCLRCKNGMQCVNNVTRKMKYLFTTATRLIVKLLWSIERLYGYALIRMCHIRTFMYTHTLTQYAHTVSISNSLHKSQKAHAYVINILWVIRWGVFCCYVAAPVPAPAPTPSLAEPVETESQALVRLTVRCILKNRQHSFVPQIRLHPAIFCLIFCVVGFPSCTSKIPKAAWILHEVRENFTALFFGSRHYIIRRKISFHYFHFQWFFLQRIWSCSCNVLVPLLW